MTVIFMRGDRQPQETLAANSSRAVHFLWKPFNIQEMLRLIDEVLSPA